MKWIFVATFVIHGLIHLIGFAQSMSWMESLRFERAVSRGYGLLWLLAGALFLAAAAVYLLEARTWWIIAAVALLVSQSLILLWWKDAKFGTLANVLILLSLLLRAT